MSAAAPAPAGDASRTSGGPAGGRHEAAARLLFVAPHRRLSFVEQDLAALRGRWEVDVLLREDHPARHALPWQVARRLATRAYRLLFVWFAEPYDAPYLLLAARLLGVPSALVVGGYELAALPALGYGALASRGGRLQVRLALSLAGAVLPTSELLAAEARALGRRRGVEVIPPGIDCDFFRPAEADRERLVVTVATLAEPTWRVKGLDTFAACSRLLPDVRFAVLGPCPDPAVAARLRALGGDNLAIEGRPLSPAELRAWYRRAAVYAQLSARESFGIAAAEAMACGCAPVAAATGGLPELVGDAGALVPPGDAEAAARAIAAALAPGPALAPRRRIESRFAAPRRGRALAAVVERLVAGARGAAGERGARPAAPATGGGRA
jgi:glycosyltransferase involved in cell wall biosynthesis